MNEVVCIPTTPNESFASNLVSKELNLIKSCVKRKFFRVKGIVVNSTGSLNSM